MSPVVATVPILRFLTTCGAIVVVLVVLAVLAGYVSAAKRAPTFRPCIRLLATGLIVSAGISALAWLALRQSAELRSGATHGVAIIAAGGLLLGALAGPLLAPDEKRPEDALAWGLFSSFCIFLLAIPRSGVEGDAVLVEHWVTVLAIAPLLGATVRAAELKESAVEGPLRFVAWYIFVACVLFAFLMPRSVREGIPIWLVFAPVGVLLPVWLGWWISTRTPARTDPRDAEEQQRALREARAALAAFVESESTSVDHQIDLQRLETEDRRADSLVERAPQVRLPSMSAPYADAPRAEAVPSRSQQPLAPHEARQDGFRVVVYAPPGWPRGHGLAAGALTWPQATIFGLTPVVIPGGLLVLRASGVDLPATRWSVATSIAVCLATICTLFVIAARRRYVNRARARVRTPVVIGLLTILPALPWFVEFELDAAARGHMLAVLGFGFYVLSSGVIALAKARDELSRLRRVVSDDRLLVLERRDGTPHGSAQTEPWQDVCEEVGDVFWDEAASAAGRSGSLGDDVIELLHVLLP